ncbi:hypothetical protein [Paraburkholderia hospita]|uniref:hypothetical protein n=1 Tax=Paraburkholderia hospita TaxID=169430 RepID=UPI000271C80C|nr:hypothetical protein [Paraburkholderia hospita]EUC21454.1 hypothetical protein PMI06_009170 [Burkholderia sp. BT03]SKC95352.1 hypothetical protein SAMN06266956_6915 [Paraburkholderia hospita]
MSREDLLRRLADITPDQLAAYLTLRGWSNDGSVGALASIWHRPEPRQEDAEVLLPTSLHAKDFRDRLFDAVDALGAYERRSPVDVIADVMGHFADRIRVRVFHFDVEGGTIPLDDGVLLNERARDLMEAAALASLSKRRQFSGRKPEEAAEYLKTLRLGQTEIGSYVVNIIAPMPPRQISQLGLPSVPVTNLVAATLSSGLRALDNAIQTVSNGGNTVAYEEAVNNGVSANLCDALVGLSGANIQRGFEVTIAPAGSSAAPSPVSTFVFDRDKVERVVEAAAYYKREDYTLYDRTITGSVEKLDRPVAEERGTVTIATLLEGQPKNVSVELDEDEYQQAVDAHGRKDVVQCHGNVRVTARAARLMNAHGFRVIRNGELL